MSEEEDKWSKERLQEELKDAWRNAKIGYVIGFVAIMLAIVPDSIVISTGAAKYLDYTYWLSTTLIIVLGALLFGIGFYYNQKYQRLKSKL